MIPWDEKMFTTTKYLFDLSTTWQYMLVSAVAMVLLWVLVSIIEKLVNKRAVRIVELYLYRPVIYIGTFVIAIGALYYMTVMLKDYIWGVG